MNILQVLQSLKEVEENTGNSKIFRKIKEYLKEITKRQTKKSLGEQELDFLTNFIRRADTYSKHSEKGIELRYIQFDRLNVELFEDILDKTSTGNLKNFIINHCNFPNLLIEQKKYDINRSNEIGTVFRFINKYFEKKITTDRYEIFPMVLLIEKVFNFGEYSKNDTYSNTKSRGDINLIKYFFSNETYLTNTQAFWVVFNQLWSLFDLNNAYTDRWLEVFSKYDRLEGGFVDRAILANGFVHGKGARDFINQLKDKNKEITVYRGFLTRQNQYVRKGIKKINNPFAEQQDEGRGLSYSTNKDIGIFFASRYHFFTDYIVKKSLPSFFGKITEDSLRDEIKEMLGTKIPEDYLKKEVRRTLGTYKIKAQDIIFTKIPETEFEIIADPNNVKLKRYDFINDKTRFESLQRKAKLDAGDLDLMSQLEKKAYESSSVPYEIKQSLLKGAFQYQFDNL
jgi:hypothetical protein